MIKQLLPLLSTLMFSSSLLAATTSPAVPSMVTIKGGTFVMGSTDDPKDDGYPTSEPVHRVVIKSFRLSRYETTVGQFREFVDATGYQAGSDCWRLSSNQMSMEIGKDGWSAPINAPSAFHPVMCVSYEDAHAYLSWLSNRTGRHFRLASEAEWEFAARAGSEARYPHGDDPAALCKYANVFDRSGKAAITPLTGKSRIEVACDDQSGLTSVVGMYQANAFGVYDMLGNAGEFVEDCEHLTYDGAPQDGTAWTSNCDLFHGSKMAIHRGGNYNSGPIGARPTYRGHAGMTNRSAVGESFRIAEDDSVGSAPAADVFDNALAQAQASERARRRK